MGMVLSVLGTILILILKILLILLLVACALLFLPIHYKISIWYQDELSFKGRVTWLGAILFLRFSYQEGLTEWILRIFGIDLEKFLLWRKKRKKKSAAKKKQRQHKIIQNEKKVTKQHRVSKEKKDVTKQQKGLQKSQETAKQHEDIKTSREEAECQENKEYTKKIVNKQKKNKEKINRMQSIRDKWKGIKSFVQSILRLLKNIKKKAEWTGQVKNFIQDDTTKTMVCILKDNVVHLWRKLKPRVLRGNIVFGTGDPCSTGEILGVAALFYAYYGKGIQVTPDFEEARLEGTLFIKGRISLITILIILVRIFLSSEWNQFKKGMDQLKEAL